MAGDWPGLDPWVATWLDENPLQSTPIEDFSPEILALARSSTGFPPTRPLATVRDDHVGDVPIRVYAHDGPPTGLIVYFHGGGWVLGSIGIMDNVARELAFATGAVVVSVEYRLAPEHPYPAGLDDCETVTRWARAHTAELGAPGAAVVVAGESAGGNLAAALTLRLRDAGEPWLAGQILMYPSLDNKQVPYRSREVFAGLILSQQQSRTFWDLYRGGKNLDDDPYAAPLRAQTLAGVPPAVLVTGGCDLLLDEDRAYAARLRDAGVAVEELHFAGQPHGFMNFGFPAAADAFERIGAWFRQAVGSPAASTGAASG
jgi:acetyl esterase